MVVRAGAVGAAVAARRWDFAGALEQAADTAAARARTNSRSAIAVTLISQPSDAAVYLIVYAPTATVSEVAVRRPPPVDGQDLAGDERRRRRGQKHCYFTYFLGGTDASHGGPSGELVRVQNAPGGEHGDELRLHIAGSDGVDPHPFGCPLDGHDLGHNVRNFIYQHLACSCGHWLRIGCVWLQIPAYW